MGGQVEEPKEIEVEDAQIQEDEIEVEKKLDSSSSSNGSFRTTLNHVKGTLI